MKPVVSKLLSFVIIFWPFGQLLVLPQINPSVHPAWLDILNLLLLLCLVYVKRVKLLRDPLNAPLLLFILAACLSLLANLNLLGLSTTFLSSLYLLRFVSTLGVYFAVQEINADQLKLAKVSLFIFLLLGLLQYLFLPDTRFLRSIGFDDHYYRLVGTLFDPNFTGAILAVFSLLLIAKSRKPLYVIPCLLALALTFSRASYIAFFVGLLTLIILKRQLKFLIAALLLSLTILIIPKPFGEGVNLLRTFSITSRLNNQTKSLELFKQSPILGVGFNSLKFTNQNTTIVNRVGGVDNSFLFVLTTTGLFGFTSFLFLLFKIGQKLLPHPAFFASYISLLIHSIFNNTLFYLWTLTLLWCMVGLASKRKTESK